MKKPQTVPARNLSVKIRLQGDESSVAAVRRYLLKHHPGLILASVREGTNPKYAGNQKFSAYGNIQFSTAAPKFKRDELPRKRRSK
tara:strand:+ start:272 stop:529 length:258 start_codon:yes stop_codon:yes gene_type:complete